MHSALVLAAMAYSGSIGSVNVLEFVSTDLFDESQENPYLLQQQGSARSSPVKSASGSPYASPTKKQQSVRFAELPLDDALAHDSPRKSVSSAKSASSPPTRLSTVVIQPTPASITYTQQAPSLSASSASTVSLSPPPSPVASRPSVMISLPYELFQRGDANASTHHGQDTATLEQAELQKLLYSLSQLGIGHASTTAPVPGTPVAPPPSHRMSARFHDTSQQQSYEAAMSAPTSPMPYSSAQPWLLDDELLQNTAPLPRTSAHQPHQGGTASLMFRSLPTRQSRRASNRKSMKRFSSAPTSPVQSDDEDGAERCGVPTSPQPSRGSVTFLTVKNLLRGGGALSRTVRYEQPQRRPTCMGTELTISSRLKMRQKFQRPTVITDAFHRVSNMKLGTSPLKAKIKHIPFPHPWSTDDIDEHHDEADSSMPSPRGQLRRESLITLETLDKIGTRHACPVQLIEEPLPDFSTIQPRVDTWNTCQRPKQQLRRPSAWLLGATATVTATPHGVADA